MKTRIPALCTAFACLMVASCELQKDKVEELQQKIYSLERDKREIDEKLRTANAELEVARKSRDNADQLLTELRAAHEEVKASLDKISREFDDYRTRFHLESRVSAVGETHDRLTTGKGDNFEQVLVRAVLGDTIQITHANGVARLRLAELPLTWQKRFDFTPGVPCRIPDEKLREACAAAASERL